MQGVWQAAHAARDDQMGPSLACWACCDQVALQAGLPCRAANHQNRQPPQIQAAPGLHDVHAVHAVPGKCQACHSRQPSRQAVTACSAVP